MTVEEHLEVRARCTYPQALAETRWPGTPYRVLRSPLGPTGSRVCVSYEAPNRAYCPFKTTQMPFINLNPAPKWHEKCTLSQFCEAELDFACLQ